MTTQEVANRLVELCRQGDYETCYNELYHANAQSVEPKGAPWEVANGMDEIHAKGKQWNEMVQEFHGASVGEPVCSENHFSLVMNMDVTFKNPEMGRQAFDEICVYEVKDGKIMKEEFFYPVQPA